MSLLGIDVGTTGCKAAAFCVDGPCLGTAYREYPTLHPREDWAELDSTAVYECVKSVIRQAAAQTRADPITALSVSSMGEAAVPVTMDRKIVGPSILCSDSRGGEYIERLLSRFSQKDFYPINPNILLGPNYTLPKLQWLRDHAPDQYHRADRFLLWGDFIPFMLGCEPLASYSLANRTLLFDIQREDWSDSLLAACGIEREKLGTCVPAGTVAGTVLNPVADELGLPRSVKVVVGGHDQCCNALGAGAFEAGKAVCGIGTFECITPTFDRLPPSEPMLAAGLNMEHHLLPHLYVSFLFNQSGTLVRWFRDTFAAQDKRLLAGQGDMYGLLSREMPEEPTRLLVLPHFERTGPPHFTAGSAGAIVGLKTSTRRGDILKAIMESVTFYFVDEIEGLKRLGVNTSEFVATGGGAKSDAWLQIKADILGAPFIRPSITEGSILGAVIMAGVSTGVLPSFKEGVARYVRTQRVFEPNPRRHRLYREKMEHYRTLNRHLRDFFAEP